VSFLTLRVKLMRCFAERTTLKCDKPAATVILLLMAIKI